MATSARSAKQLVEIVLHGKDVSGPAFVQAEKNASKLEKQINKLGNVSMLAGGAIVTGVVAAVKQAGDLEGYVADALTLVNAQGDEFSRMKESMTRDAIAMSRELGVSANEIAKGFYQVISSGAAPTTAAFKELSRTAITLARLTGLDTAYAVETLAGTVGAFGYELSKASRVADVFFVASKNTLTTVPQLAEAFKAAAPAATALGMSLEDTATLIDALAAKGVKGSEAGTALRMMLIRMTAGTAEVKAAMKDLGAEMFDEQGKMRDILVVLSEMQVGYRKLTDEQKAATLKVIAGDEAFSKLASILDGDIKLLEQWRSNMKETGVTTEAYKRRLESFTGQMDLLKTEVQATVLEIGRAMLPALTSFVKGLREGVSEVTDFIAAHQNMIKVIFAVGLALIGAGGLANAIIKIKGLVESLKLLSLGTFGVGGVIAVGVLATIGVIVALLDKMEAVERKADKKVALKWAISIDQAEQVRTLESLLVRYKNMLDAFGDETKITVDIEPLGLNAVPLKRAVAEVAYELQRIRSQPIDINVKLDREAQIAELEETLAAMRDKLKRFGEETQITVDVKALDLKGVKISTAIDAINDRLVVLRDKSREAGQGLRDLSASAAAGQKDTAGSANDAAAAVNAASQAQREWNSLLDRMASDIIPRSTEGVSGFGTEVDNMLKNMSKEGRAANIEFLQMLENARRASEAAELQEWLNRPVEDPLASAFNDETRRNAERQVDRLQGHFENALNAMTQDGNVFENLMKSIWRALATEFISAVARMIAKWIVFKLVTAGLAWGGGTVPGGGPGGGGFEAPVPIPENLAQHGGTIARGVRGLDTVRLKASRGETVLTPELTDALKERFMRQRIGNSAGFDGGGSLHVTINALAVTASEQELVKYGRKTRRALFGYDSRFVAKGTR